MAYPIYGTVAKDIDAICGGKWVLIQIIFYMKNDDPIRILGIFMGL